MRILETIITDGLVVGAKFAFDKYPQSTVFNVESIGYGGDLADGYAEVVARLVDGYVVSLIIPSRMRLYLVADEPEPIAASDVKIGDLIALSFGHHMAMAKKIEDITVAPSAPDKLMLGTGDVWYWLVDRTRTVYRYGGADSTAPAHLGRDIVIHLSDEQIQLIANWKEGKIAKRHATNEECAMFINGAMGDLLRLVSDIWPIDLL